MPVTPNVEPSPVSWECWSEPESLVVHDRRMVYRQGGSGDAVLYLHGLGLTRRWLPFHEALSNSRHVVAPEQPGFGDSEPSEWGESWEDVVLHYADLLDLLGHRAVHVVGTSLGGWLAARFATTYPERTRSLALVAPLGMQPGPTRGVDIFRLEAAEYEQAMIGDRPDLLGFLIDGDDVESALQRYAELTAAASLMWNPRYDRALERRLSRVAAPALVIGSRFDRVVPLEECERYANALPNGTLHVLEAEGHALVAIAPEDVANAILDLQAE